MQSRRRRGLLRGAMCMKNLLLIFPHQLFERHPGLASKPHRVALIEDSLFFGDTAHPARFHQQKLWLHRATMKRYEQLLRKSGHAVDYVEHVQGENPLRAYLESFHKESATILVSEPHDHLLSRRLTRYSHEFNFESTILDTPMFLNTPSDNGAYRKGKKRWFMADFYKFQRRRLDVLMEGEEPEGGKWSYDDENRKKVPKAMLGEIPQIPDPPRDAIDKAARRHVQHSYDNHPGNLERLIYPTSHKASKQWLDAFLNQRFALFGDYEDAIVAGEHWLWHSVLTPMINTGMLTPKMVLDRTLRYAEKHDVPLNALEGFVRQIIGWREFMRATYDDLGVSMRTTNHWGHTRPIPETFYSGTTGILPLDDVIGRVLSTGYCHHIERLMVVGGFMFLCEFDPDHIYRWFMEMFVDSYDWVMVPNVYAMSQHADGGQITTKPYFSGSSYIRKMSNYPKGEWATVWDGLYWRWIWNHRTELAKNPRWAMMCAMVKKMDATKRKTHLEVAEKYLKSLDA